MNIQARIERDFAEPSVMIKYGNTIIGKIPLIFLTSFDIYDCVKEFDNVISILQDLVNPDHVLIFIKDITKIMRNEIEKYDHETLVSIIVLLEYFQYDSELNIILHKRIKGLVPKEKQIPIYAKVLHKTGKVWTKPSCIYFEDINRENIDDFISILINGKFAEDELLHAFMTLFLSRDLNDYFKDFIDYIFQNHQLLIRYIHFEILPNDYKNDWKNYNIKSPIAKIFSHRLIDIGDNISVRIRMFARCFACITINPAYVNRGNKKTHCIRIKNISTNEVIVLEQYCFEKKFPIDWNHFFINVIINEKYFTDEWYLICDENA